MARRFTLTINTEAVLDTRKLARALRAVAAQVESDACRVNRNYPVIIDGAEVGFHRHASFAGRKQRAVGTQPELDSALGSISELDAFLEQAATRDRQ